MSDESDIDIPEGLSPEGLDAANAILNLVRGREGHVHTGGCRAFYTPAEWAARGEEYGLRAELIVVHDGGVLARYFNPSYGRFSALNAMFKAVEAVGLRVEPCTAWYTAIYKM